MLAGEPVIHSSSSRICLPRSEHPGAPGGRVSDALVWWERDEDGGRPARSARQVHTIAVLPVCVCVCVLL